MKKIKELICKFKNNKTSVNSNTKNNKTSVDYHNKNKYPSIIYNEDKIRLEVYYSDWLNPFYESVFESTKGFELELIYIDKDKEIILSQSFVMKNISGIRETDFDINSDYSFRFGRLETMKKYKNIGVISYLILQSILPILENLENANIVFSLVNTSQELDKNGELLGSKLYNSILTKEFRKNSPRIQYRIFSKETRKADIIELKKMIREKEESIIRKIKL